jgi:hypothetical protein
VGQELGHPDRLGRRLLKSCEGREVTAWDRRPQSTEHRVCEVRQIERGLMPKGCQLRAGTGTPQCPQGWDPYHKVVYL